jgi:hypothetical protein
MTEFLAALIGVVAGALASGGIQTWQVSRDRKLAAKVAARLLTGDLLRCQETVKVMLGGGRWPTSPTGFKKQYDNWLDQRLAFATAVDGYEFNSVGAAFEWTMWVQHRMETEKPGEQIAEADVQLLEGTRERLEVAILVVVKRSLTPSERKQYVAARAANPFPAGAGRAASTREKP